MPSQSLAHRLEEIQNLNQDLPGPWHLIDFQHELQSPLAQLFLWPDAQGLEGFVLYRVVDTEAWVMNLAVKVKGHGQGTKLLKDFFVHLRQRVPGLVELGLEVSTQNTAAVALYAKLGFAEIARRPRYYKDGSDACLMKFTLPRE